MSVIVSRSLCILFIMNSLLNHKRGDWENKIIFLRERDIQYNAATADLFPVRLKKNQSKNVR